MIRVRETSSCQASHKMNYFNVLWRLGDAEWVFLVPSSRVEITGENIFYDYFRIYRERVNTLSEPVSLF